MLGVGLGDVGIFLEALEVLVFLPVRLDDAVIGRGIAEYFDPQDSVSGPSVLDMLETLDGVPSENNVDVAEDEQ